MSKDDRDIEHCRSSGNWFVRSRFGQVTVTGPDEDPDALGERCAAASVRSRGEVTR